MSAGTTTSSPSQGVPPRRYAPTCERLSPATRHLLETYGKIPSDKVLQHVHDVRDKAWVVFPYPCIGEFRFLDLFIGQHDAYPEILERLKGGQQTFLDLGCAVGQDIRRLVADGVESSLCYGSDLRGEFFNVGYDLFGDRETLQTKFVVADIFDDKNALLEEHAVGFDIIQASSFFHLFDWDQQKHVARSVSKLLKPKKDSLIVGRQVGAEDAMHPERVQGQRYLHNLDSWSKLWKEVSAETGINYDVQSRFMPGDEVDTYKWRIHFTVRRLD